MRLLPRITVCFRGRHRFRFFRFFLQQQQREGKIGVPRTAQMDLTPRRSEAMREQYGAQSRFPEKPRRHHEPPRNAYQRLDSLPR